MDQTCNLIITHDMVFYETLEFNKPPDNFIYKMFISIYSFNLYHICYVLNLL